MIKRLGDARYEPRYVKKLGQADGNGLKIIDWAPDSSKILLHQYEWVYETDSHNYDQPVLYDIPSARGVELDMDLLLRKFFGRQCRLQTIGLGFTAKNEPVIRRQPQPWDEWAMGNDVCTRKNLSWMIDLASNELRLVPHGYRPQHYGRKEPK